MSLPIVEQIAQAIQARIEGVLPANGYTTEVQEVVRPTRLGGYAPRDSIVILGQGQPEAPEYLSGNPCRLDWRQPFVISLCALPSDDDTTPIDTLMNVFRSDVEKAICTPAATWHMWGGLAVLSEWGQPVLSEADGGFAIVQLTLIVNYRTPENDPYTVG